MPGRGAVDIQDIQGQTTNNPFTADCPRTDVADVTTYSYYPADDPDLGKRGNLATVGNALGRLQNLIDPQ